MRFHKPTILRQLVHKELRSESDNQKLVLDPTKCINCFACVLLRKSLQLLVEADQPTSILDLAASNQKHLIDP
jgi:NAD-dependent dihydropyrimidine dehydrogenase PreA subunit